MTAHNSTKNLFCYRAEDLMRESQYPPRMKSHEKLAGKRREVWRQEIEEETAPTFKPRLSTMPDFELLHKHGEYEAMSRQPPVQCTVVKPFKFHSAMPKPRDRDQDPLDNSWESAKPTPRHGPVKMPIFSGKETKLTASLYNLLNKVKP